MSSYFVNPLFSKYKGAESLEPTYYDCRFPQSVTRTHGLVYGAGATAPGFQPTPHHVQDFFHHGTPGISTAGYQQNPCALACHGDATKFYGYDALPRQSLYGAQQEASVAQYPDCKSSNGTNLGDGQGHLNQTPSPGLMFPWMRPHGQLLFLRLNRQFLVLKIDILFVVCVWVCVRFYECVFVYLSVRVCFVCIESRHSPCVMALHSWLLTHRIVDLR